MKLTGWQKDIITEIDGHYALRESQEYQGCPDYLINKATSVTVSFPKKSGHTLFANFLANKYKALVVYGNLNHYLELTTPQVPAIDMHHRCRPSR
jgi:hypothetical protein